SWPRTAAMAASCCRSPGSRRSHAAPKRLPSSPASRQSTAGTGSKTEKARRFTMTQYATRSRDSAGNGYDSESARHSRELKLVADLERLPGVVSAAVWLDDTGAIRDVRITASPVSPRLIVANAASAVLRRHGFEMEPAAIHVDHARAPAEDAVAHTPGILDGGAAASRYLLLHELSIGRSGGHVTIAVQIGCRGEVFRGEATEMDSEAGRVRAAVRAARCVGRRGGPIPMAGLRGCGRDTFRGEATDMDSEAGRIRAAVRAPLSAAQRVSDGVALGLEATSALDVFGRRFVAVPVQAAAGRRF